MIFFCPSPLPFGGSTVLSLTRGPAGNRTTTGSLSATQECRDTNCTTRTITAAVLNEIGVGMDVDAGEVGEAPEPMTIDRVDEDSEGEGSEEEEGMRG